MADDVILPGTGEVVQAVEQTDGSKRQVVAIRSPAANVDDDPLASILAAIVGSINAGDVDTSVPASIGGIAVVHGANPGAEAAGDKVRAKYNRAGILFVIGGHPNVIARSHVIADSDGPQTDAALLAVSAGAKIVVTQLSVKMNPANSTSVAVRIGFGAATIPASSLAGTNGILLEGKFAANGGHQVGNGSGILGAGADGEDLRITCDDPVSGDIKVSYSYYTIES